MTKFGFFNIVNFIRVEMRRLFMFSYRRIQRLGLIITYDEHIYCALNISLTIKCGLLRKLVSLCSSVGDHERSDYPCQLN